MSRCIFHKLVTNYALASRSLYRNSIRQILSPAYSCQEAWTERLNSPIFKKVNAGELAIQINDKLEKEGAVSAIDIDVLANKLDEVDKQQLDFVQNVFKRFYRSQAFLDKLESTDHGLVRTLLAAGETDRLLDILTQKLEYGIFLDTYTTCLTLDLFIKAEQYHNAVQIAFDQMLQEDFSHPLTSALSWWACHQYLRNPPVVETEAEEMQEEEEDEVTYVKVDYIEDPWYDDHFDIPTDLMKLGKTLVMLTDGDSSLLGNSYRLLGWGHYEKFEHGLELLENLIASGEKECLAEEALTEFSSLLTNVLTKEAPEEKPKGEVTLADKYPYITEERKQALQQRLEAVSASVSSSGVLSSHPLEPALHEHITTTVAAHEAADIEDQRAALKHHGQQRAETLARETEALRVKRRKEQLVEKLLELKAQDERLRFFEQEDKVNLGISRRRVQRPIEEAGKEEEVYVNAPGERGRTV